FGDEPVVDGAEFVDDGPGDAGFLPHFAFGGAVVGFVFFDVAFGHGPQEASAAVDAADEGGVDLGHVHAAVGAHGFGQAGEDEPARGGFHRERQVGVLQVGAVLLALFGTTAAGSLRVVAVGPGAVVAVRAAVIAVAFALLVLLVAAAFTLAVVFRVLGVFWAALVLALWLFVLLRTAARAAGRTAARGGAVVRVHSVYSSCSPGAWGNRRRLLGVPGVAAGRVTGAVWGCWGMK